MTEIVLLFAGQSSRDAAMFDRLATVDADVASRAAALLPKGWERFETNQQIQVSVTAANLAWLELLRAHDIEPVASAGLSLGEYAHLVEIGALDPDVALELVEERGRLYDAGPDGCMAAIYPATWSEIAPLVGATESEFGPGSVAPAVFASPTQTVVGGERAAVEALIEACDEDLFTMSSFVEDHIPMHTPRFEPVASALAAALEAADFTRGERVYWANTRGEPTEPTADTIRSRLREHVFCPVRWHQTIDGLVAAHPEAVFLEVGPRTVLRDLMKRRWHSEVVVHAVDDPDVEDLGEHFARLLEALGHAR